MATLETIDLGNAECSRHRACERHPGWPLHIVPECNRLAGVEPYSKWVICSVCDQDWGQGVASAHLDCATLASDGTRTYSRPVVYVRRADLWIEVKISA